MLKYYLVFILLLPSAVAARDLIRLGFTDYPPFISSDAAGQPHGKVIAFIENNLGEEFQIEWRKLPISRSKQGLQNGSIDAYPFLSRSPEHEAYTHFPAKPYMTVQPLLCSLPDAEKPATEVSTQARQLERKSVVHPEGSEKALGFLQRSPIRKIRLPYDNYNNRVLEMLDAKRVDYAIFVTSFGIEGLIEEQRVRCRTIGEATGVYFALARNSSLIPKVEAIFESLDILRY